MLAAYADNLGKVPQNTKRTFPPKCLQLTSKQVSGGLTKLTLIRLVVGSLKGHMLTNIQLCFFRNITMQEHFSQ